MCSTIITYYDFDWDEVSSRLNEDEFYSLKETNYEYWHVITCQDYGIPAFWDYKELANKIVSSQEGSVEHVSIEDVIDLISDRTGWLVSKVDLKNNSERSENE